MRILISTILLLPLMAIAAGSFIAEPENAHEVLGVENAGVPQEYFGRLSGYPHTYEFAVGGTTQFKATVFVHDNETQANDASLIVIKEERRGVSEVGRTKGKNEVWGSEYDAVLVESFKNGGFIESELQPGVYRLEVSSPNNDAAYRLVLGTEKVSLGYFEALGMLFEVKSLLGRPLLSVLQSPLVYWPLLLLLLFVGGVSIYMYRVKLRQLLPRH